MANKQIELTTPSFRTTGSAGKPILAVWVYRDNSLAIAHLDFKGAETLRPLARPASHQIKFDDPAELLRELDEPRHGAPRPARRRPLEAVPAAEDGLSRRPPEGSSIRDCDPRRDDLKAFWIGLRFRSLLRLRPIADPLSPAEFLVADPLVRLRQGRSARLRRRCDPPPLRAASRTTSCHFA